MEGGRIVEHGTYADLMSSEKQFHHLISEFGQAEENQTEVDSDTEENRDRNYIEEQVAKQKPTELYETAAAEKLKFYSEPKGNGALMQTEDRAVGAIGGKVFYHCR